MIDHLLIMAMDGDADEGFLVSGGRAVEWDGQELADGGLVVEGDEDGDLEMEVTLVVDDRIDIVLDALDRHNPRRLEEGGGRLFRFGGERAGRMIGKSGS